MDLDTFIISTFCIIDDTMNDILQHRRLRQRGPNPSLSDSEVLTIEVVGEYLSLHQDKAIFDYFCRHYSHFFPALKTLHRTTFVRQAANLRSVKELVWKGVLAQTSFDPEFHIIDSLPLPACRFARAYRCRRFKGDAAFGHDSLARQTFYGFRLHALVAWPGVIVGFSVASANIHETAIAPELASGRFGIVLGDRNYWSPRLTDELAGRKIDLVAPFKTAKRDPRPRASALLARFRYRIETVFSQLVDRYQIKRVEAKDMWHLSSRLLRKALSHTIAFMLNQAQSLPLCRQGAIHLYKSLNC